EPGVRVVALLTTVNAEYDRVSIHGVRRSILREQSDALGLPLFEVEVGATSSNEEYRAAFARGLTRLREAHPGLESMAFGDIFLADVRSYREALLAELGWRGVYPLWDESTVELSDHFIERGYQAVLTCVDTTLIPTRFAGREYDR